MQTDPLPRDGISQVPIHCVSAIVRCSFVRDVTLDTWFLKRSHRFLALITTWDAFLTHRYETSGWPGPETVGIWRLWDAAVEWSEYQRSRCCLKIVGVGNAVSGDSDGLTLPVERRRTDRQLVESHVIQPKTQKHKAIEFLTVIPVLSWLQNWSSALETSLSVYADSHPFLASCCQPLAAMASRAFGTFFANVEVWWVVVTNGTFWWFSSTLLCLLLRSVISPQERIRDPHSPLSWFNNFLVCSFLRRNVLNGFSIPGYPARFYASYRTYIRPTIPHLSHSWNFFGDIFLPQCFSIVCLEVSTCSVAWMATWPEMPVYKYSIFLLPPYFTLQLCTSTRHIADSRWE